MEQNFKIITVCAAVGSGHPIVTKSELNKVLELRQNQGNSDSNNDISQQVAKWLIKDDENILREPEIRIVACETVGEKSLHAIAYCDIFDKKKGQKKLPFFATGFASMEDALCHWAAVANSTTKPIFGQLFGSSNTKDDKYLEMKQLASDVVSHVNVLTENQRTVEWFTHCTFHLSATMAGLLFNSNSDNKTDGELLNQLSKSWFSQNRSTQAMVIGAKMRVRYYRHFRNSVTLGAYLKWDY